MRYLFFLLSILYSFIFYLFYAFSHKKDLFWNDLDFDKEIVTLSLRDSIIFSNTDTLIIQSFFWNLFIEMLFFLFLAFFLFFYFAPFEEPEKKWEKASLFLKIFSKENIILFYQKSSYYIGFILFYLSLYLISLGLDGIDFSYFILSVHIIIFWYFLVSKFSHISRIFLRINSIIFSLFYLLSYLFVIFTGENIFSAIDFINGFLVLLIFPVLLYYERNFSQKKLFDNSLLIHFSLYIFGFLLFYFYIYIFKENLLFWISLISIALGMIWFEVLPKNTLFQKEELILKYIGINFSYFGIFTGMLYFFFGFSWILYLVLIWQIAYHFYIHHKYSNYISVIFWLLVGVFIFFYSIVHFEIISMKSLVFILFTLFVSLVGILVTYLYEFKHDIDNYIVHIFSHIINIFWVICFLIFQPFQVLYIWILLLFESIYFFTSYHKLNPKTHKKRL